MKRTRFLSVCGLALVSLATGSSIAAPASPTYSVAGYAAAMALVQQNVGQCTGPQYGALVQQCIATRCTGGGSVAECASSCQAQVRAQCGA